MVLRIIAFVLPLLAAAPVPAQAMQLLPGNQPRAGGFSDSLSFESIVSNPAGDFNRSDEPQHTATFDKSPPVVVRPDIGAAAYMVVDPHTGSEIISHNAHTPLPPASLTKIMTAYVLAEYLKDGKLEIQAEVPVSERAQQTPGSRMFIQPNRAVTVDQLLLGLITVSGNDAAVALAEYAAGSVEDFVTMMNRYAQSLGMINCVFTNPHGLHHPDMKCSINDFMVLCQALLNEHPAFYKRYFGNKDFTYNGINQRNRNRLLFYAADEIDGIKTGSTDAAGYNLIVSGVRGYRLIAGVMGSKGLELRNAEVSKLLTHAYVYYRRYLHYNKGETVVRARVFRGKDKLLALGLEQDLYSTLPYVQRDRFKVTADIPQVLRAPIARGEKIGDLVITFADSGVVIRRPLIALQRVDEASIISSLWDELAIWLGLAGNSPT